MQKFKFPMNFLRVTQGEMSNYSHAGSLAMDFGGRDSGVDKLYCPCDMAVKRCRHNATGEMYLESIEPVLFADGTIDYARLLCIHDGSFNKAVGDVVKQGEYFYDEGGMGGGNPNRFATHVHIEAGKGKWQSTTQHANAYGTYVCERQAHLYDLFILGKDVQIIDDGGYSWVVEGNDAEDLKAEIERLKKEKELLIADNNSLMRMHRQAREELAVANNALAAERKAADVLKADNAKLTDKLNKIKDIAGGNNERH